MGNLRDKTITITKLKDSWSKEEVIELINKHSDFISDNIDFDGINNACCHIKYPDWDDDKWVEENL